MRRTHKKTRANYNKLSRWYDAISGNAEWKLVCAGIDSLNIQHNWKVLEVGFGTGRGLVYLKKKIKDELLIGVDISEGMISKAQDRVIEQHIEQGVCLIQGDAVTLPSKDSHFDAVCMCFTLELFSQNEIRDVLFECRRVMNESAKILVVGMLEGYESRFIVNLYRMMQKWFPHVIEVLRVFSGSGLCARGSRCRLRPRAILPACGAVWLLRPSDDASIRGRSCHGCFRGKAGGSRHCCRA